VVAAVLLFGVLTHGNGNATLINVSNATGSVLYDDGANQYWLQDLQMFYALTFQQQVDKLATLNSSGYFGINSWHLAALPEMQ
jgi:hypothetical protein